MISREGGLPEGDEEIQNFKPVSSPDENGNVRESHFVDEAHPGAESLLIQQGIVSHSDDDVSNLF